MLWPPAVFGGTLRLVAVGLGGAAIAILLHGRAERPSQPTLDASKPVLETAVEEPNGADYPLSGPPVTALPGTWSLRTGGWYIRVDGAEIAIPSVHEQTAAPPRASLGLTISPYDKLIVYHAAARGFDWRLIAALIFEESHFDPTSRSDKGAYGLMQVRPIAAEAVGAERFETPDDNVKTGVGYLGQLDEMFHEARGRDRLSLVLAAYNMGPGHVRDAQTLARQFGYDPNRWEDAMDLMLPLLEEPAICENLPNGFAKGRATVAYVQRILDRYQQYKRRAAAAPGADVDRLSSRKAAASHG
jgi:hypothetical protein